MRYLKTFESFSNDVNEGFFDKAKQALGIKSADEKIKLAFEAAQKGELSDLLKKAYNDLKAQDSLFPMTVISGMAPNVVSAIERKDASAIKKITEEEIAKVFFESKTVAKSKDGKWEGTGRGAGEGLTGSFGATPASN